MVANEGERAATSCTLSCSVCHRKIEVEPTKVITRCKDCGSRVYDILTGELEIPGNTHEKR